MKNKSKINLQNLDTFHNGKCILIIQVSNSENYCSLFESLLFNEMFCVIFVFHFHFLSLASYFFAENKIKIFMSH